jgi:hypothetical protein
MKKSLLCIAFFMLTLALFGSGYTTEYQQPAADQYQVTFTIDAYEVSSTVENGTEYATIEFDGGVRTTEKGFASLPYLSASVQLLNNRNVTLAVETGDFTDIRLDAPLLPSRGTIYRNQDPATIPYEISQRSIVDAMYPQQVATASEPFAIRDVRGTTVYVYPFQYNAAQSILRVYHSVNVRLVENNEPVTNAVYASSTPMARVMDTLYRSAFINYQPASTRFDHELDELGSILVIYTNRDVNAIEPYIQWKQEKGHTVYTEEVTAGTNVESTIQNWYDQHNDILYVQLVGDWAEIKGPTSGGAPVDPNMGCVVGTDIYPDIIIGRFSANNADHVTAQVNKVINYEKTPDVTADWYHHGLGIGSGEGPGDDGEDDYEHIDIIKEDKLLPFTYDDVAEAYGYSASVSQVATAVNAGVSIINYTGHGSSTSWVTTGFNNSNVNQLSNGDKLPFIFSVACVNGEFQNSSDCFAEAWLKKADGGALGMYASTINQSWNPPMMGQDYMNDLLIGGYDYAAHAGQNGITTDVQKTTFGAVCFNGSILMCLEDPSGGPSMLETWHIFGDPSVQVRTDTPKTITLSNDTILMGVDYTTTVSLDGSPVEGAIVTLSNDDEVYTGVTDASGSVTIAHGFNVPTCTMVVTAFNGATIYNDAHAIIPPGGPYVAFGDYTLDDSAGNGNGQADYGETLALNLTLANVGVDDATNVQVTLSSTDSYVTITDATEDFGTIPANGTQTVNGGFTFELANDIPDGHMVTFDVEAVGQDTWNCSFSITAHAPVLEMVSFSIDDTAVGNGDYMFDAGETVDIVIELSNNGSADAAQVNGLLTSGDQYITINTTAAQSFGDLAAAGTATQSFSVTSDAATPQAYMAGFLANFSADLGITASATFNTQIGGYLIEEYFDTFPPTGWTAETNWQGNSGSEAGGQAPEAELYWSPSYVGDTRLISPVINTTGATSLNFSFKHYYDDYSSSGDAIGVATTSDGGATWNTAWEVFPTDDIGPENQDILVETSDVGSNNFQIAFYFSGNTWNMNHWYVDDAILAGGSGGVEVGYISGIVSLQGGNGNVEDVSITLGTQVINPDANGAFTLSVVPGTYSITASLDGYQSQTQDGIVVIENEITTVNFSLDSVSNAGTPVPNVTAFNGNYPNPFNPTTTLMFSLNQTSRVALDIFNIRGQKVRTLISKEMEAGYHSIEWNGTDDNSNPVGSGVYFSKFHSEGREEPGDFTSVKKMIIMK